MRYLVVILTLFVISGCSSIHYQRTHIGDLHGKLTVQWLGPDRFVFIPDEQNPLTFVRSNKQTLTPQKMYTDGGSIPRPISGLKNYSPWGYAPAFIVHDWLFVTHHCHAPGYENMTYKEAALVMSEIMKTMMKNNHDEHPLVLFSMYEAVRFPKAKKLWDTGKCDQPSAEIWSETPKMEYTIEFP